MPGWRTERPGPRRTPGLPPAGSAGGGTGKMTGRKPTGPTPNQKRSIPPRRAFPPCRAFPPWPAPPRPSAPDRSCAGSGTRPYDIHTSCVPGRNGRAATFPLLPNGAERVRDGRAALFPLRPVGAERVRVRWGLPRSPASGSSAPVRRADPIVVPQQGAAVCAPGPTARAVRRRVRGGPQAPPHPDPLRPSGAEREVSPGRRRDPSGPVCGNAIGPRPGHDGRAPARTVVHRLPIPRAAA